MSNTQKEIEAYQPLFNILHEHGLIPLESEMDEIIRASLQVVENINQQASIAQGLKEAEEIHCGKREGKTFDDFLNEL